MKIVVVYCDLFGDTLVLRNIHLGTWEARPCNKTKPEPQRIYIYTHVYIYIYICNVAGYMLHVRYCMLRIESFISYTYYLAEAHPLQAPWVTGHCALQLPR